MGLEAATFINQLVATNPVGATDPKSQGDDHLRLIKATLQATFAAITGAVTTTHTELNQLHGGVISSVGSGTVALPTYSFASDPDTGVYRDAANQLSFTAGGVRVFTILSTNLQADLPVRAADGAVGAPAFSFSSAAGTGMYRLAGNAIAFAIGGVQAAQINSAQFFLLDGAVGAPAYSFLNDTDTGIYRVGANDLGIAIGAARYMAFNATVGVSALQIFGIPDGAVGNPSLYFNADGDTGLFRSGTNGLSITAGGSTALTLDTVAAYFRDGAAANPALTFLGDTDTGFYRDTANQIAIALGGATAGQIAQGTFNLAITGCSAGFNAACSWQRVGNKVTLMIGAASGTSVSTAMTGTGLPAIIQPPTAQLLFCHGLDNTIASLMMAGVGPSGTITFRYNFNAAGFTAAGTKGVGIAGQATVIEYLMG